MTELRGVPEVQVQLTVKYLRTQEISTNLWGVSHDHVLYDPGMLAIACTGPCCNCVILGFPLQKLNQIGPGEHLDSSPSIGKKSCAAPLSTPWVGVSVLLDTEIYQVLVFKYETFHQD